MLPQDLPQLVANIPYLSIFIGFSVGLTQLIKDEFAPSHLTLRLTAAGTLVGSALLFNYLPADLQPYYLLLLIGIAVPGVVGLYKETRRQTGTAPSVVVTAEESRGA